MFGHVRAFAESLKICSEHLFFTIRESNFVSKHDRDSSVLYMGGIDEEKYAPDPSMFGRRCKFLRIFSKVRYLCTEH